ncbi:MAG: vWA domain-containing protein, partial [Methylococcales bacterium]
MINFGEFHFLRPDWFWALPVLFLLAVFWLRRSLSRGSWAEVCDARLLPYILEHRSVGNSRVPWLLFVLASLLSLIALAGPVWKRLPAPVYRNESALVIVLDLSRSMDAEDIRPSRLSRARFKISDILQQRKDGLTALVGYAHEAYTVAPLTDDSATISNQLPALETSIMPAQGSRTSPALERAVELLQQSGNPSGNILLITDGVDSKASDTAEELSRDGYRLSVLGIGSEAGAPIPMEGGGFIKDAGGNIVVSRLET